MGICQSEQRTEIKKVIKYQLDRNPAKVNSRLKLIEHYHIYTYGDLLQDQYRGQFEFELWEQEKLYQLKEKQQNKIHENAGSVIKELENNFKDYHQKIIHLLIGEDEQEKHKLIINFINIVTKVQYSNKIRYNMEPKKEQKVLNNENYFFRVLFNVYEVNEHIFISIDGSQLKNDQDCIIFRSMVHQYFQEQKVKQIFNIIFITPVTSQTSVNDNEKRLIQNICEIVDCIQIQFLKIVLTKYDGGDKIDKCITSIQSPFYQLLQNFGEEKPIFFCNNYKENNHNKGNQWYKQLEKIWSTFINEHGQATLVEEQNFKERNYLFNKLNIKFNKLIVFKKFYTHVSNDYQKLKEINDKYWKETALNSPDLLAIYIEFSENNFSVCGKDLISKPYPNKVPEYIKTILNKLEQPQIMQEKMQKIENEQKEFPYISQAIKEDIQQVWEFKTFYKCFLEEYESTKLKYEKQLGKYLKYRQEYYERTFWPQNETKIQDIEQELEEILNLKQ